MKRARIVGAALALGGLVAVSGFVWLPVPLGVARAWLDERGAGFEVSGAAHLRWATGDVRVRDVALRWNSVELGRAEWVGVRLDLRPWRGATEPIARVEVGGAAVALDEAAVRALIGPEQAGAGEFSGFEVVVRDGRGSWRLADGTLLELEELEGRCVGWPAPDGRPQIGVEGDGRLTGPAPARLEARVLLDPRRDEWRAELNVTAAELPPPHRLALSGGGAAAAVQHLEWERATLSGRLILEPAHWWVEAQADAHDVRHSAAPIGLDAVSLRVAGDARAAVRVQVDARNVHGEARVDAELRRADAGAPGASAGAAPWPGSNWRLDATARLEHVDLDAALRADLQRLMPEAAAALDALGLSGQASGRVRVMASLGEGAPPPLICAYAPGAGLGLDYAGFPDAVTGDRFSFRLPLAVQEGGAAWAGGALLIHAGGVLGEAEGDPHGAAAPPAHVTAHGVVEIKPGDARVTLDLRGEQVSPTPRLGAALTANPQLADLWRELGDPRGGAATVRVQVRPQSESHDVRVHVTAHEVRAMPPRLGLPVSVAQVELDLGSSGLSASATAEVGGIAANVHARMQTLAGGDAAQLWDLTARLRGLPDAPAWDRLAAVLPTAPWLRDFRLAGTPTLDSRLRFELRAAQLHGPASWTASAQGRDLTATWLPPAQTVRIGTLETGAAGGVGGMLVEWTDAGGSWQEGAWSSSGSVRLAAASAPPLDGRIVALVRGANVDDAALRAAVAPLGVPSWTQRMSLGGAFSVNAEVPLATPADAMLRLDLEPLVVLLPEGALQRAARREAARFELAGRLHASAGSFETTSLLLTGPDVELELRDCTGRAHPGGLTLQGQAVSARGLRLRPPLGLIAPQKVLNSLDRIGLDGDVAPRDLRFECIVPSDGAPTVRAHGTVELLDFRLDGPPPVREGAGWIECEEFVWRGPEDFTGRFRLTGGSARVAGIGTQEARAEILLQSDRVTVTRFAASALGGSAATEWLDADGGARQGGFELGLAGNAAIRSEFRFEGFELERLGEELGFRGPLAGKLSGEVAVRGTDPSPIHYRGQVRLGIRDGVLGTVPVLAQLWSVLGIEAPTFSQGELRMTFLGEGRVLVDNFSLQHPLLEVTGERILTMDSYLGLKVTVRTFGFLGRLPLVRDVLDFLVEHDVYGPASALRLRQRGLGKLFAGDVERVPFPLWMPRVARPDWRKSPTLPVVGPALRTPAVPHP